MGCLRVLQKQTILTVDNSDIKKELKYFAEKLYSLFLFKSNAFLSACEEVLQENRATMMH